jgi:hypothetical protein
MPLTRWASLTLFAGALWVSTGEPASAQAPRACGRDDMACLQFQYLTECARPASTLQTCLVYLQKLETTRRPSSPTDVTLLLARTLRTAALKEESPRAKERYLERARDAYRDAVQSDPQRASGYLGLAELAQGPEDRVEWLRGAVQAEHQPAHMELLSESLTKVGTQAGDLESPVVLEEAYTLETSPTARWRYGVLALQQYGIAVSRYPSGESTTSLDNVVLRIKDDIDYPLQHRILLEPDTHLTFLADAFATLCENSIGKIVGLDECLAGLELAVTQAEGPVDPGSRRLLAEAALNGMRTIAGETPPKSAEHQAKFIQWLDRLLVTDLSPVDVPADLLEARADFSEDVRERVGALLPAVELCPNRGDLRLKLGAAYVNLELWPEALEQLRVADYLVPPEDHKRVEELVDTATKAYEARFLPPEEGLKK